MTDKPEVPITVINKDEEIEIVPLAEIKAWCKANDLQAPKVEEYNFLGDKCWRVRIEKKMPRGNMAAYGKCNGQRDEPKELIIHKAYSCAKSRIDSEEVRTYV